VKLAVAVAAKNAPESAFVVWRGIEESIRKAAGLGYHGIELALRSPQEVKTDKLARWLSRSSMEVSCISTGQVFSTEGLYFTHPDPDIRNKVVTLFSDFISLASDFGRMVNIGRVRGFVNGNQTLTEVTELFYETLKKIMPIAEKANVVLVLEPVNRYETNFINSVEQAATYLRVFDSENIGLMPDLFHMNIEDKQIGETIARFGALVKYIHLADSNRYAPGMGHLDFDHVFKSLHEASFNGWVAIEILPFPDPDTAATQAAQFILPKIARYNKTVEFSS
jgi:sugar phosphate isomerase/epimerase